MGLVAARNSIVERKWIKDSQHFHAKLRDHQVVAGSNSHQMYYSVASLGLRLVRLRTAGELWSIDASSSRRALCPGSEGTADHSTG